jgi:hypothetical protein
MLGSEEECPSPMPLPSSGGSSGNRTIAWEGDVKNSDGPEIEIYPSEYRQIKGKRRRKREPPIYWGNLAIMIISIPLSIIIATPFYLLGSSVTRWLITDYLYPLLP